MEDNIEDIEEDVEQKEEDIKMEKRQRKSTTALSPETIARIQEMYEKGYKATEIAGLLNVGVSTVYKYTAGMTSPLHMSRTGRGGIISPEREVARQVEYDITREAIHKVQDSYNIGYYMEKVVRPMAESYGLEPKEFVEMCVEFWEEYHNSVYEWKRENEVLRALLNQLLEETEPQALEALKKRLIANYLLQLSIYLPLLGITPTQELLLNCVGAAKEIL